MDQLELLNCLLIKIKLIKKWALSFALCGEVSQNIRAINSNPDKLKFATRKKPHQELRLIRLEKSQIHAKCVYQPFRQ